MAATGFKQAIKNLSKLDRNTVKRLVIAVQATQAMVTNDARRVLRPGHGFITGTLQKSILPGRVVITNTTVEGEVVAGVDYASFVEFGTSRSRPIPYLGPAVLKNQSSFRRLVKRAVRQ